MLENPLIITPDEAQAGLDVVAEIQELMKRRGYCLVHQPGYIALAKTVDTFHQKAVVVAQIQYLTPLGGSFQMRRMDVKL